MSTLLYITTNPRSGFLLTPIRMTFPECTFPRKVRFSRLLTIQALLNTCVFQIKSFHDRPRITRYLRNDVTFFEKLPILAAPLWFVGPSAVNLLHENSSKPYNFLLRIYSPFTTYLSLIAKDHVHSVTLGQLRKPQHTSQPSSVPSGNRTFKFTWALRVIQGHSY